jgi:hypothetical protein
VLSSGALPSSLAANQIYYLMDVVGGTDFKLGSNSGGAAIDLTDEGVGPHYLARNPVEWWSRILSV